jgi:hypothetical protein
MWPASGGHPRVPPPGPVGDLSKSPADGRGFTGLPCAAGSSEAVPSLINAFSTPIRSGRHCALEAIAGALTEPLVVRSPR